ncbi:aspartate racemase [Gammaproteobacteria bacterium]
MQRDDMVVGVIGGMGPYATLSFFKCLLDNTPSKKDRDHLHVIIDNNPKIPSRTRAFLFNKDDPVPAIVKSANSLKFAGADFLVMPCNSAHYFLERVREQVDIPFINMIEKTCREVLILGPKSVGVLAGEVTVKGRLYEQFLEKYGIKVLQVSDKEQVTVRNIIEEVKNNSVTSNTRKHFQELLGILEEMGADVIVLGCTELPFVVEGISTSLPIVDSAEALAKAVVRNAKRFSECIEIGVTQLNL